MNWLLCINNKDYKVSLEVRKIYEKVNDPIAEQIGMVRIIDESGESYLYSKDLFVEMPAYINQALDGMLLAVS